MEAGANQQSEYGEEGPDGESTAGPTSTGVTAQEAIVVSSGSDSEHGNNLSVVVQKASKRRRLDKETAVDRKRKEARRGSQYGRTGAAFLTLPRGLTLHRRDRPRVDADRAERAKSKVKSKIKKEHCHQHRSHHRSHHKTPSRSPHHPPKQVEKTPNGGGGNGGGGGGGRGDGGGGSSGPLGHADSSTRYSVLPPPPPRAGPLYRFAARDSEGDVLKESSIKEGRASNQPERPAAVAPVQKPPQRHFLPPSPLPPPPAARPRATDIARPKTDATQPKTIDVPRPRAIDRRHNSALKSIIRNTPLPSRSAMEARKRAMDNNNRGQGILSGPVRKPIPESAPGQTKSATEVFSMDQASDLFNRCKQKYPPAPTTTLVSRLPAALDAQGAPEKPEPANKKPRTKRGFGPLPPSAPRVREPRPPEEKPAREDNADNDSPPPSPYQCMDEIFLDTSGLTLPTPARPAPIPPAQQRPLIHPSLLPIPPAVAARRKPRQIQKPPTPPPAPDPVPAIPATNAFSSTQPVRTYTVYKIEQQQEQQQQEDQGPSSSFSSSSSSSQHYTTIRQIRMRTLVSLEEANRYAEETMARNDGRVRSEVRAKQWDSVVRGPGEGNTFRGETTFASGARHVFEVREEWEELADVGRAMAHRRGRNAPLPELLVDAHGARAYSAPRFDVFSLRVYPSGGASAPSMPLEPPSLGTRAPRVPSPPTDGGQHCDFELYSDEEEEEEEEYEKGGTEKNGTEKDGTEKDEIEKDETEKGGAEKDRAEKEGAEKEGAKEPENGSEGTADAANKGTTDAPDSTNPQDSTNVPEKTNVPGNTSVPDSSLGHGEVADDDDDGDAWPLATTPFGTPVKDLSCTPELHGSYTCFKLANRAALKTFLALTKPTNSRIEDNLMYENRIRPEYIGLFERDVRGGGEGSGGDALVQIEWEAPPSPPFRWPFVMIRVWVEESRLRGPVDLGGLVVGRDRAHIVSEGGDASSDGDKAQQQQQQQEAPIPDQRAAGENLADQNGGTLGDGNETRVGGDEVMAASIGGVDGGEAEEGEVESEED